MQIEVLSVWRIKPYINLDRWEKFHEREFPLNHYEMYCLEDFNLHEVGSKVRLVELSLVDNEYDIHYHIPINEFEELMYQVMEAPPLQLEPKPYLHGKRIRVRQDLAPQDQERMNYYHGIWDVEFLEGCEGRYNYMPFYRLSGDGGGCMLQRFMVEEYFEEVVDGQA